MDAKAQRLRLGWGDGSRGTSCAVTSGAGRGWQPEKQQLLAGCSCGPAAQTLLLPVPPPRLPGGQTPLQLPAQGRRQKALGSVGSCF